LSPALLSESPALSPAIDSGQYQKRPAEFQRSREPIKYRAVRVCVALFLLTLSGAALFPFAVIPVSSQAVVNARLSRVTAPIEGSLQSISFETGDIVSANEKMAEIHALPATLLARNLESVNEERELAAKSSEVGAELDASQERLSHSRQDADKYAVHLASELQSQLQAAQLSRDSRETKEVPLSEEVKRDTQAVEDHLMPRTMLDQAEEKLERARSETQAAAEQVTRLQKQIADVKAGYLLGQNAQAPASIEQRDQAEADTDRLRQQKLAIDGRLTELRRETSDRAQTVSGTTAVVSPVSGPIWVRSASPAQAVGEGDDLFRIADAQSIHVEVWLDRRYGPQLSIGDTALVYLSGMGKELTGKVVSFQGTSRRRLDEEVNAIDLQPVHPDQYHVTIELTPSERQSIYIGQAAKVLFPGAKAQFRAKVYSWLTRL
jgi:multidrug resistance efflux pump